MKIGNEYAILCKNNENSLSNEASLKLLKLF